MRRPLNACAHSSRSSEAEGRDARETIHEDTPRHTKGSHGEDRESTVHRPACRIIEGSVLSRVGLKSGWSQVDEPIAEPAAVSGPSAGRGLTREPSLETALRCGLGPLLVGSAVYWLWVWTNCDALQFVGLFTIVAGCIAFLVGLASLAAYVACAASAPGADRSGVIAKSVLVLLILLANVPAAGLYWKAAEHRLSSRVEPDWIRARSCEFLRDGPDHVPWQSIGDHLWHFDDVRFGARYFSSPDGRWVVLFLPDGDAPLAYALESDRHLHRSPDDPASCGCEWSHVKDAAPSRYNPSDFEDWPEFR